MAEPMYRQCELERETPVGKEARVLWIPERYAKIGGIAPMMIAGKRVEWLVSFVSSSALPESIVRRNAHDWTRQRKASDI